MYANARWITRTQHTASRLRERVREGEVEWGGGIGRGKRKKEKRDRPRPAPIACIVPGQRNHEMHGRCPHMSAQTKLFFIFFKTKCIVVVLICCHPTFFLKNVVFITKCMVVVFICLRKIGICVCMCMCVYECISTRNMHACVYK